MTMVNLDDEIYQSVGKFVEKRNLDYPTIKNFVDKAVRKLLKENQE